MIGQLSIIGILSSFSPFIFPLRSRSIILTRSPILVSIAIGLTISLILAFSVSASTALVPVATSYFETVSFAFANSSFADFTWLSNWFFWLFEENIKYTKPLIDTIVNKLRAANAIFIPLLVLCFILDLISILSCSMWILH